MTKQVPRQTGRRDAADSASARSAANDHPLRNWILGAVGMIAAAPAIGMVAGFLLLFGGIFIGVAWQIAAQPLIDAHRYTTFTASAAGKIVESWAALEFDPRSLPAGKLYWSRVSKISRCAVVEYNVADWGTPLRRAFCGMQLHFDEHFRLHDWTEMLQEGVPFTFLRDGSGFEVQEIRLSKSALEWISTHPPTSTFMLSMPPPTTALAELNEQLDWPIDIARLSWTTPVPSFPLRYDPLHPELAMPATVVEASHERNWIGVVIMPVFAFFGLMIWRFGMQMFFANEPSPLVIWILTLLPLLALPWWGDALPKLLVHVNRDWASIAGDMMDDVTRMTRLIASAPADATLADGERIAWHLDQGEYAQTFGRIRFVVPVPAPTSTGEVFVALSAQAAAQFAGFGAAAQVALLQRLSEDKQNRRDRVQSIFVEAAQAVERDPDADPAVQRAARHFLIVGAGRAVWEVDALENSGKRPAAQ